MCDQVLEMFCYVARNIAELFSHVPRAGKRAIPISHRMKSKILGMMRDTAKCHTHTHTRVEINVIRQYFREGGFEAVKIAGVSLVPETSRTRNGPTSSDRHH